MGQVACGPCLEYSANTRLSFNPQLQKNTLAKLETSTLKLEVIPLSMSLISNHFYHWYQNMLNSFEKFSISPGYGGLILGPLSDHLLLQLSHVRVNILGLSLSLGVVGVWRSRGEEYLRAARTQRHVTGNGARGRGVGGLEISIGVIIIIHSILINIIIFITTIIVILFLITVINF